MYKEWTVEEVEYLKQNAGKIPNWQIAESLGRSKPATLKKALKLGISTAILIDWSSEEVQFLKDNCHILSMKECAAHLHRPYGSTKAKASECKISFILKPSNPDNKICSKCRCAQPKLNFFNSSINPDGLAWICRLCSTEGGKEYRKSNVEKEQIRHKIYNENNKDKLNRTSRLWKKRERETNPNFRIIENMRSRMRATIVKGKKSAHTIELLGCSGNEARLHLESKFQVGMSWANYGKNGWEIDHIIPCSSFDLEKSEDQHKCFHWSNLQPLWQPDNRRKSNKLNYVVNELQKFNPQPSENAPAPCFDAHEIETL